MTTLESYLNDLWQKTIEYLSQIENSGLDKLIIDTYYANARLVSLDNNKAVIVTGNEINKQVIKDKTELIELAMNYLLKEQISCAVITEIEYRNNQTVVITNPYSSSREDNEFFNQKLKDDFTFENFVVGQSNNEARSAALAWTILYSIIHIWKQWVRKNSSASCNRKLCKKKSSGKENILYIRIRFCRKRCIKHTKPIY